MDDRDIINLQNDCLKNDIGLFVTDQSEIENYFCSIEHIARVYQLTEIQKKEIEVKINQFYEELKTATIRKIKDFIGNHRRDLVQKEKRNETDFSKLDELCEKIYQKEGRNITPGKELLGKIKNYLQYEQRLDPQLILNPSSGLRNNTFQALVSVE